MVMFLRFFNINQPIVIFIGNKNFVKNMKYIKLFNTHNEYETYIASEDKVLPNVSLCEDARDVHYNPWVPPHDYSQDYFTMVVTVGGDIKWSGSTTANTLSYSKDNGATWSTASSDISLSVNEGDRVLWKGTTTPIVDDDEEIYGIGTFSGDTDVRYSVEGNAMSLLFGDNFKGQTSLSGKYYAFYDLFSSNKNITSAENLSLLATTLASCCYSLMFYNCTNLTTAPELPATTLANQCYRGMFYNCTSLTTAPELPATTLASNCYRSMFAGCTSLTTAPELPATTLNNYCYSEMFYNCTRLNSIKCLATNISASNCTDNWVSGVAASGTFTKATSMTSWTNGKDGIPSGWDVVNA